MLGYTQIRPCFQSHHLRWTDAFFQGALDYAGIQGFAPVGTKALNLVAGTHLLKVGSSLGWGQGFLFYSSPKKQSFFRQRTAPLCGGGNRASFCQVSVKRSERLTDCRKRTITPNNELSPGARRKCALQTCKSSEHLTGLKAAKSLRRRPEAFQYRTNSPFGKERD